MPTCETCRFWGTFGKCNKQSGWKGNREFHVLITTEHYETCGEHQPKENSDETSD